MVVTALQARTALAITAAGVTLIGAIFLSGRPPSQRIVPRMDSDGLYDGPTNTLLLSAELGSTTILPGDRDQDIAVTIHAPYGLGHARAPLSLAVVIDRSGSMNGVPMQNAKTAAADLVDRLAPEDMFTIVTFSSGAETVMPISSATPTNKAAARAAISRVWDDGGTCISCGVTRAEDELAHSRAGNTLRRIVLISDGQANEGVWDRSELADLASATASHGNSISTVGVGLDFDELTMIHLAEVGRGNYYFVENTANLSAMFTKELSSLSDTVAADVMLVATPSAGIVIDRAYGYPVTHDGRSLVIPIADLRSGELRKVVLPAQLVAPGSPLAIAHFELRWRDPFGATIVRCDNPPCGMVSTYHLADVDLSATVVDDPGAVAASIDLDAVQAIAEARSAQVLDDATVTYERQGYRAAQQLIEHHLRALRANKNLDPAAIQKIDRAAAQAIDGFASAPAGGSSKAMKATRTSAYDLAH